MKIETVSSSDQLTMLKVTTNDFIASVWYDDKSAMVKIYSNEPWKPWIPCYDRTTSHNSLDDAMTYLKSEVDK